MDDSSDMSKVKRKGSGTLPFAGILKKTMDQRRLTLKEVSALAEVSISVVENWLRGSNPHDLQAVDRLSQKLGVPFKKLLLGVDETLDIPGNVNVLFDETELFNGIVRLKVTKLDSKKKE